MRSIIRGTLLGRLVLIPWRFWQMIQVTAGPLWRGLVWTFASREHHNYTYDLEVRNLQHLAAFISVVSGRNLDEIRSYIDEILGDQELQIHILRLTQTSQERYVADTQVRFGRRIGWYALVRALKPQTVVETGVDKGLGTVVIAAALRRNANEGHPGQLFGIDIDPRAGYLLSGTYTSTAKLILKDSLVALKELPVDVDFFIHDSDHNAAFEEAEYNAVSSKLSANAFILSDNAEHTDKLLEFASKSGRKFLFFSEKPKDHWWPGEGIGVAYRTKS